MKSEFDIQKHMLVPKHEIMTEEEISNEFSDADYDFKDLPKIKVNDPVAKSIGEKIFGGTRWGNSVNSVRLYFSGLQNHCRW